MQARQPPLSFTTICSTPYYDSHAQETKNILTLSNPIKGPLAPFIATLQQTNSNPSAHPYHNGRLERTRCLFGLRPLGPRYACCFQGDRGDAWMETDDIPSLFAFLSDEGYVVETALTQMMHEGSVTLSYPLVAFVRFP